MITIREGTQWGNEQTAKDQQAKLLSHRRRIVINLFTCYVIVETFLVYFLLDVDNSTYKI